MSATYLSAATVIFKFHYVSINSINQSNPEVWKQPSLNSIMFLLIPYYPSVIFTVPRTFKFHYVSINSPVEEVEEIIKKHFKFHYVSINSCSGIRLEMSTDIL